VTDFGVTEAYEKRLCEELNLLLAEVAPGNQQESRRPQQTGLRAGDGQSGGATLRRPDGRSRRFEAIFQRHHSRVLSYARRHSSDRTSAEDVVSEAFLVAWRRLDAMPKEPLPWLLGTTRNVLANQRRSTRRRDAFGARVDLDFADPPHPATSIEERVGDIQAVAQAFTSLSVRDRDVLTLIAWDGLEPREAAQVMDCSSATFSLRLHRARQRLKQRLITSAAGCC
jgi:RNA polymerase sigma-70 factor, ECF subfamily